MSKLCESRSGDGSKSGTRGAFFFSKSADAVCPEGTQLPYPMATANLHHEVELIVAVVKNGTNIPVSEALDYVFAYAVRLDLTRRDLQKEAKKKGRPWATAKGFDRSAPCYDLHKVEEFGHIERGKITISVNGETRQQGDISDMIWSVAEVISSLSSFLNCAQET